MTYEEAYRKARKMVALGFGKKKVLIVRNQRNSHRAYYQNDYACKQEFFPIVVLEL